MLYELTWNGKKLPGSTFWQQSPACSSSLASYFRNKTLEKSILEIQPSLSVVRVGQFPSNWIFRHRTRWAPAVTGITGRTQPVLVAKCIMVEQTGYSTRVFSPWETR